MSDETLLVGPCAFFRRFLGIILAGQLYLVFFILEHRSYGSDVPKPVELARSAVVLSIQAKGASARRDGTNAVDGARGGWLDVRTGLPVLSGNGELGDLTISRRLTSGVYQYRQVLPTALAVEGALSEELVLEIEGEVAIQTQHLFAPTRVVAITNQFGPAPRLIVYAGQATRFFQRANGEVDEIADSHGSAFFFSSLTPTNDLPAAPGGMLTLWTSHPGKIDAPFIDVSGGDGYEGGAGGQGGDVVLDAHCEPVRAVIRAHGGKGSQASLLDPDEEVRPGGRGGNAGSAVIYAWSRRGFEETIIDLNASGGAGGNGTNGSGRADDAQRNGGDGSAGGHGGDGGRLRLILVDGMLAWSGVAAELNGGTGGAGGSGGNGSGIRTPPNFPGNGGLGGTGGDGGLPGSVEGISLTKMISGGNGGRGGMGGWGGNSPFNIPSGNGGNGGDGGAAGSENAKPGGGGDGGLYGILYLQTHGTKGDDGAEGGVRADLSPPVPVAEVFPGSTLDYAQWNVEGSGNFFDAENWLLCSGPGSEQILHLNHDLGFGDLEKTLFFEGGPDHHTIQALEVESGWWHLDMAGSTLILDGLGDGLRLNEFLILRNGTLETPAFSCPENGTLKLVNSELIIQGDFALPETSTLQMILDSSMANSSKALIHVEGDFLATGNLQFQPAFDYTPQPGDRFRLVKFKTEIKTTQLIYDFYRFKHYNSQIAGSSHFWGLAYRKEGEDSFIELLVLKTPLSWQGNGQTEPWTGGRGASGLVLITHGTWSDIGDKVDGKFGEIADTIHAQVRRADWDVVTVDWSEYSTSLLDLTLNPATSAQISIGIAESLDHALREGGWRFNIPYQRFHLMAHSSGCWLVNRLMQLWTSEGSMHLTFFDAFTNPALSCTGRWYVYCDRFIDKLGQGSDGDDFIEHYVDRSISSPNGTDDRLTRAVNFDVTGDFWSVFQTIAAHAHPYDWYLETIKGITSQIQRGSGFECGGYFLAPELIDRLDNWPLLKSQVLSFKGSLRPFDLISVNDQCQKFSNAIPALYSSTLDWISNEPSGSAVLSPDGKTLQMNRSGGDDSTAASALFEIVFPRPTQSLQFFLSFGGQLDTHNPPTLEVALDGMPIALKTPEWLGGDRFRVGPISLPGGEVVGSHELAFRLNGQEPVTAIIDEITPIVTQMDDDPSILLEPIIRLDGSVELGLYGPVGDQVIFEVSSDLVHWSEIANIMAEDAFTWIVDTSSRSFSRRYYRTRSIGSGNPRRQE